jgi:hypothetical protein
MVTVKAGIILLENPIANSIKLMTSHLNKDAELLEFFNNL